MNQIYVGRQPILDKASRVSYYEVLYKDMTQKTQNMKLQW